MLSPATSELVQTLRSPRTVALIALVLATPVAYVTWRRNQVEPSADELERDRREYLAEVGRITDGSILETYWSEDATVDTPHTLLYSLRVPLGVCAIITPWNFPLSIPVWKIAPALVVGNTVVFKPSEKTPATGKFLVDCYHAAGVPEGSVRLLVGGPDQGKALAEHRDIDGLLFTGSARTGW